MNLVAKLFGLFLISMSMQLLAGTDGRAWIKEKGIQLYRVPKLLPPTGWTADEKLGQHYQMIALAPSGKSFADSAYVMYAKAMFEPKRTFSLDQHIQGDISDFRTRDPKAEGNPRDSVKDLDSNSWRIVDFIYADGKITNYETVAYLEEGEYIFHLVLSSRSKDDFAVVRPQFIQWVAAYRNLPETAEQDRRSDKSTFQVH